VPPLYQDGYAVTYPPKFFGKERREGVLPVGFMAHEPERGGFTLYRTRNAGRTWLLLRQLPPIFGSGAETSMQFMDLHTGWALKNAGSDAAALLLTQDGGQH